MAGQRSSASSTKRKIDFKRIASSLRLFSRVVLYAFVIMLAVYLLSLALFLITPSISVAAEASPEEQGTAEVSADEQITDEAGADEQGAAEVSPDEQQSTTIPTYDSSLGGGSGILPAGLSEDDATFTSIARLESGHADYDNTLVTFRGEVVGEPLNSSTEGYRWVLVQASGSSSSIEVLMSNEQIAQIANWGSYQVKGATVRVTGIYHVADLNNTGTLDVIAYVVNVVDEGGPVEEDPVDMRYVIAGCALIVVGLCLSGFDYYRKKRSRS